LLLAKSVAILNVLICTPHPVFDIIISRAMSSAKYRMG